MRVEFRDDNRTLLYDADMGVMPRDGDTVTFPSGRFYRVTGPAEWVIGEREPQHLARLRVVAPPKRPASAKSAAKKVATA